MAVLVNAPGSSGARMTLHSCPVCVQAKSLQSCLTLCRPIDYSPPGSSIHGILQARILEWAVIPPSKGSSWPRDQTRSLLSPALAGRFFTTSTTWEAIAVQVGWAKMAGLLCSRINGFEEAQATQRSQAYMFQSKALLGFLPIAHILLHTRGWGSLRMTPATAVWLQPPPSRPPRKTRLNWVPSAPTL